LGKVKSFQTCGIRRTGNSLRITRLKEKKLFTKVTSGRGAKSTIEDQASLSIRTGEMKRHNGTERKNEESIVKEKRENRIPDNVSLEGMV